MSRRDFLKLICVTGGAITLTPFMKLGKVFSSNVSNTSTTDILNAGNRVGLDGVSFLYPTKPGGFAWYLNAERTIWPTNINIHTCSVRRVLLSATQ